MLKSKKKAKRIAKRKVVRKKAPKKKVAKKKKAQGIKIYRSGLAVKEWKMVNPSPSVIHGDDDVSIRANIAVNTMAERQSEVLVRISSETLIELFEAHFGVKEHGIGSLVLSLRKARFAANALLNVIDDLKENYYWAANYGLDSVPLDNEIFDSENLAILSQLKDHKWV